MINHKKNPPISLNSEYYSTCSKNLTNNTNIYLGGHKFPTKSLKSHKKGINLSKSLSSQNKITGLNYSKTTIGVSPKKLYLTKIPMIQSLKLDTQQNHFRTFFQPQKHLNRSHSSPFMINYHFLKTQRKIANPVCTLKNNNNFFAYQSSQTLRNPHQNSGNISRIPFNQVRPVTRKGNFEMGQEKKEYPTFRIVQQSGSKQNKQKFNLKSNYIIPKNPTSQRCIKFHVSPVKVNSNSKNNLLHQGLSPSYRNETKKVIIFKSPTKTTNKLQSQNQKQKNAQGLKAQQQQSNLYQRIPQQSLKQSISTAEQKSNQSTQYKSQENLQNPENSKKLNSEKRLNYSVKSLWDSVDNCSISLICENHDQQQGQIPHSVFNNKTQRTYNDLSNFKSLTSLSIDNVLSDKKASISIIIPQNEVTNIQS